MHICAFVYITCLSLFERISNVKVCPFIEWFHVFRLKLTYTTRNVVVVWFLLHLSCSLYLVIYSLAQFKQCPCLSTSKSSKSLKRPVQRQLFTSPEKFSGLNFYFCSELSSGALWLYTSSLSLQQTPHFSLAAGWGEVIGKHKEPFGVQNGQGLTRKKFGKYFDGYLGGFGDACGEKCCCFFL